MANIQIAGLPNASLPPAAADFLHVSQLVAGVNTDARITVGNYKLATSITNANSATMNGYYTLSTPYTNGPTTEEYRILHIDKDNTGTTYAAQLAWRSVSSVTTNAGFYVRNLINGSWTAWSLVWNAASTTPTAAYAAGTAYTLTATPAAIAFGTTQPTITIPTTGNYMLRARVHLYYNGATFAAARTVPIYIQRTNNSPGAISNTTTTLTTAVTTTVTATFQNVTLPEVVYAATAGDVLTLYGSVSVIPSAGSFQATEAMILAEPC